CRPRAGWRRPVLPCARSCTTRRSFLPGDVHRLIRGAAILPFAAIQERMLSETLACKGREIRDRGLYVLKQRTCDQREEDWQVAKIHEAVLQALSKEGNVTRINVRDKVISARSGSRVARIAIARACSCSCSYFCRSRRRQGGSTCRPAANRSPAFLSRRSRSRRIDGCAVRDPVPPQSLSRHWLSRRESRQRLRLRGHGRFSRRTWECS